MKPVIVVLATLLLACADEPAPVAESNVKRIVRTAESLAANITKSNLEETEKVVAEIESLPKLTEKEKQSLKLLKDLVKLCFERLLGVRSEKTIGEWTIKAGVLDSFGTEYFGKQHWEHDKFAYATYNIEGGWTLGIRFFEDRSLSASQEGEKVPTPLFYLQGPIALLPGQVVQFSRNTDNLFYPQKAVVQADGTIFLGEGYPFPGAAKSVTYRFGKDRFVTFKLDNALKAYEIVKSLPDDLAPLDEPAPQFPKPPPR